MNRDEIIKGLECCQTQYNRKCGECPYKKYRTAAIIIETCEARLKADLLKLIRERKDLKIKTIGIRYTILDIIEVPDDFTDDEIQAACEKNWSEYECSIDYDDLEWEEW